MDVEEAIAWLRREGVLAQSELEPITHDAWNERADRDVQALQALRAALVGIRRTQTDRVSQTGAWIDQFAQNEARSPGSPDNWPPIDWAADDASRRFIVAYRRVDADTLTAVSIDDHSELARLLRLFEEVDSTQRRSVLDLRGAESPAIVRWLRRADRPVTQLERQRVTFDRDLDRAIERIDTFLSDNPPEEFDNPNGVILDFRHPSLIRVTYSHGSAVIREPIDPIFAVRVVRFLRDVKTLGYTRVYSNGFGRDPKRPIDRAHPSGRAWDIAGFDYHGTRYHLASGRPPEEYSGEHLDELGHARRGASTWFNPPGPRRESTEVAPAWRQFERRLTRHFGAHTYIGPGHNASHMNHFHVQLDTMRSLERSHVSGAPATSADPRPYLRR